jgi:hypothetical protein
VVKDLFYLGMAEGNCEDGQEMEKNQWSKNFTSSKTLALIHLLDITAS